MNPPAPPAPPLDAERRAGGAARPARRRKLLWWAPVAVLVLLAIFWDWNWFAPLVEARASAALERPVTLSALHVSIGRTTTVALQGLAIGNPQGFPSAPPFAEVPRLTLRIDALAFLRNRRLVVPEVALERPVVHALATEDGRNNYALPLGAPAGEGAARGAPEPPRIGALHITEGRVVARIPRLAADFQVAVGTRDAPMEEPRIEARAEGTFAGQPVTAVLLGGGILSLRDAERPWPVALEVVNGATRVLLSGTLRDPLDLAGADLRLELAGPDMARLQPLTGVPVPQTPPFRVSGRLDYADGRFRFTGMEGQVGRTDLSGAVSVRPGRERSEVTASLASQRVDLEDLAGFIGSAPGRPDTPGLTPEQRRAVAQAEASPRLLPTVPINIPKLTAADVRLSYRAEAIQGRGMPFDSLDVGLELAGGTLTLRPLTFGLGAGRVEGALVLAPRQAGGARLQAEAEFRDLSVERLLAAAGLRGAGTLRGRAKLAGAGASVSELLGRADGSLTAGMSGGDLSALIVDLAGLQFGRAVLSALGVPERTRVECLIGDFALRRGVLETRTLLLDTESSLTTGTGRVDLGRETLELRLRSAAKHLSIGALPTTIAITGSLKSPAIAPEAGELAARGGAAAVLGLALPPLALLPTIQLGVGENDACERLEGRARAASRRERP